MPTMHGPLLGGQVQRLALWRSGGREIALLKVRVPPAPSGAGAGENAYVVMASGMGVGLLDEAGRLRLRDAMGSATSPGQGHWRERLVGGRIVGVQRYAVAFVHEGKPGYASADGGAALRLDASPAAAAEGEEPEGEALAARGVRIVEELARASTEGRRDALRRALSKAIGRLDRRIEAIRGDLSRMRHAEVTAEQARLFVAQAAHAPRGATKLEAVDWASGEGRPVEIVLDPARGAREQIDAMFKRARRLKEGATIARTRLADAQSARDGLSSAATALAAGEVADLSALEAKARAVAPRDFRLGPGAAPARAARPSGPRSEAARLPYRTFLGASGSRILVGRGAAHNDTLTFRVARPHDLWLHAKNMAGAHVVVPLDKAGACSADVLVEAAHLAAHFSDARDERLVEVQYTPRRYLRKPRGSPPGLVVVDREKVMLLRLEDERLAGLLQREVAD